MFSFTLYFALASFSVVTYVGAVKRLPVLQHSTDFFFFFFFFFFDCFVESQPNLGTLTIEYLLRRCYGAYMYAASQISLPIWTDIINPTLRSSFVSVLFVSKGRRLDFSFYLLSYTTKPIWKRVYSKRKEFAPAGSKFFLLRVDYF